MSNRALFQCARLPSGEFCVWWGVWSTNVVASVAEVGAAASSCWGGSWAVVLTSAHDGFELWCSAPDDVMRAFHRSRDGYRSRGAVIVRPVCESCGEVLSRVCADACRVGAPCLLEAGHAAILDADDHPALPVCRSCLRVFCLNAAERQAAAEGASPHE